jgi:hypothetical protein
VTEETRETTAGRQGSGQHLPQERVAEDVQAAPKRFTFKKTPREQLEVRRGCEANLDVDPWRGLRTPQSIPPPGSAPPARTRPFVSAAPPNRRDRSSRPSFGMRASPRDANA